MLLMKSWERIFLIVGSGRRGGGRDRVMGGVGDVEWQGGEGFEPGGMV